MTEPRTADDLMATEWHRERSRVWREGGPAPSQFDDDVPDLADEADAVEGSMRRQGAEPPRCIHCRRAISLTTSAGGRQFALHAEGHQRGLMRCDTADSGLPYGYNAHREGTPCEDPCLGAPRRPGGKRLT